MVSWRWLPVSEKTVKEGNLCYFCSWFKVMASWMLTAALGPVGRLNVMEESK